MTSLFERVQAWIDDDPDETTRVQAAEVLADAQNGDEAEIGRAHV